MCYFCPTLPVTLFSKGVSSMFESLQYLITGLGILIGLILSGVLPLVIGAVAAVWWIDKLIPGVVRFMRKVDNKNIQEPAQIQGSEAALLEDE